MKTPPFKEEKYFEHPKYAEFLVSLGTDVDAYMLNVSDGFKQVKFETWLSIEQHKEDVEDFKNLVPIHVRMNTEEWNWFKSRLGEEYTEKLPNLRALVKHPPKSFKDLD